MQNTLRFPCGDCVATVWRLCGDCVATVFWQCGLVLACVRKCSGQVQGRMHVANADALQSLYCSRVKVLKGACE